MSWAKPSRDKLLGLDRSATIGCSFVRSLLRFFARPSCLGRFSAAHTIRPPQWGQEKFHHWLTGGEQEKERKRGRRRRRRRRKRKKRKITNGLRVAKWAAAGPEKSPRRLPTNLIKVNPIAVVLVISPLSSLSRSLALKRRGLFGAALHGLANPTLMAS